ncbi:DUF1659 domain-containing protein [Bacillus sp. DX1.1]|uniref:DUF1659 domain-containing protein n=1 Tax=unclassified Bacillus (in: firmicutes) TaxID=185979 RepID=UPI0025711EC5|nr:MULTISPECIES: DUF1659 domain-containing protein [unclassified Bacillus (in: firmicutes)]MDM5157314.1 DUF1659 domain-containing protein [Bacillus sp. DX1.1]WJE81541.1 DUF1659 domain-containing protein [Bacillus sp. DX3.1]
MAIQTIVSEMSLRLVFNGGTDEKGKSIMKNKQFKKVKPNADLTKAYEVANALSSLQELRLDAVQILSTADLSNQ